MEQPLSDVDARAVETSVPGLLARLGIVLGVGTAALALVGVLVVFGPFAGIRSVFVGRDPVWGTCYRFALSNPCHDLPLSTVEDGVGVVFPSGTKLMDSTATWELFGGGRHLTALVRIPESETPPVPGGMTKPGNLKATAKGKPFSTGVQELRSHGVTSMKLVWGIKPNEGWWAITGHADEANYVFIFASVQT